MKSILITGGAGFIGSHCADLFLKEGYEVGIFDIKKESEAVNIQHCRDELTYIEGDIRVIENLGKAMSGYEYVLHLAAEVSVPDSFKRPIETHETNVTGTLNVFASAAKHTVRRVVYASSAAVYGDTSVTPTNEEVSLCPTSPYGIHKQTNESYGKLFAQKCNLPTTGLRFFNVYGSRQDPTSPYSGVISIFQKIMQNGENPIVYGDGSATRDFIHVHDVARACLLALDSEEHSGAIYNIGTQKTTSINNLIEVLNDVLHCSVIPTYEKSREGDILNSCAQTDSFRAAFGFDPKLTLKQGLQEMVENNQ